MREHSDFNDFNKAIIDEFRANGGKVGGGFDGAPMVLVHHKGAKTGTDRVSPLVYQADGDNVVIFASKGGAPDHPHWYLNLLANPRTKIEVGPDVLDVQARVAEGEERDRLWTKQKQVMPNFAEYEAKTAREIPVIVFERV